MSTQPADPSLDKSADAQTIDEAELPSNLKNLWLKALSAIELRNHVYAISLLQAVLKEEPKFLKGRMILRKSEVEKLKSEKKLIKFPAGGMGGMKFAGQIKKDPFGAIEAIEKVLESDPHNVGANQSLHDAAIAVGMLELAGFALETVRQGHPDNTKVGHQLANFYMDRDMPGLASAVYRDIAKHDPTDLVAIQGEKNSIARASMKNQKWDSSTSLKDLVKDKGEAAALEQESRSAMTADQMQEQLVNLGEKYAEDPNDLAVVKRIANLYEQLEDWDNALTYYDWGFQLSSGDTALERKVDIMRDRQRAAALKAMEEDLAAETDPAAKAEKRAKIDEIRRGQSENLIAEARRRVERNPTDAQLRYELGNRLFDAGDFSEALPELQKAKNHAHLRARTLVMIGKCYEKKNMNDLAVRQFAEANEELVEMDDTKKDVLYQLGQVYTKMGESEKVLECLKQIYEADYGYKDVAKLVEESYGSE